MPCRFWEVGVDGELLAGSLPVRQLKLVRAWVRFNAGEAKAFDFTPLLASKAFAPLADPAVFAGVCIGHGVPVWNDGEIDISPELLYEQGESAGSERPA